MTHALLTPARARPLAALAALLLCATLTACGGDSDPAPGTGAGTPPPATGGGDTPEQPATNPQMKCAP